MAKNKPPLSLSLDLDNKWSYMKTHGDDGWQSFPSYFDIVVPRCLEMLKKYQLTITFFVVGQDAALENNHQALRSIADAGHEIGNHSFHHEPWLHLYSREQIEEELTRAEQHIQTATGEKPHGFRGPGFSVSENVLSALLQMGYTYDCSTFPTYLGPLARAYYFMTTKLSPEEREQRKKLFGTFSEGLRPNKPYQWDLGSDNLMEIPVTTMPIVKIPIHASYVLFLAKITHPSIAMLYFNIALALCRLVGVQPSILLHPLDFMTSEDVPELDFFPAMQTKLDQKLAVMDKMFDTMNRQYDVMSMEKYATFVKNDTRALQQVSPKFT